ncbi:hypothetical protein CVT25_003319 [Psilocybe cyanescens]|uniref:GST N-terminal domain-containing protein n=1 Tax=Psilocybe cyanescens TaxID=93625 RepID=A0A409WMM3_PSICY|nr:hypothetical protein CVT25_003319 [Psilocybe cyanescens]
MPIVLYDIPSALPEKAWNFNVWKTRISLNFKGIPYTTQWIEFPDIEPLFKKLGIPPSRNKADGSPFYTIPAIHDPSTGVYITDSILIAEYLDKTYPEKPLIIPHGTLGVQSAFNDGVSYHLKSILAVSVPSLITKLNPPSANHMLIWRGSHEGPKVEVTEQWKAFENGLSQVDVWYSRNGGKGPFFLGDIPSWADIVMASFLAYTRRTLREESKEWQEIISWNGGRWKSRSDIYRAWETVS